MISLLLTDIRLMIKRFRNVDTERGANLAEYSLLVVLIVVACIAAVTILGEETEKSFDIATSSLATP